MNSAEHRRLITFSLRVVLTCSLAVIAAFQPSCPATGAGLSVRIAILDFEGDEKNTISGLLRSLALKDEKVDYALVDEDLARAAARGSGLGGNLNLSLSDARSLGHSLGADFYILGKYINTRRLGESEAFYFEALAGIFLVETRSGELIKFLFKSVKAENHQFAEKLFSSRLEEAWLEISQAIFATTQRRLDEIDAPVIAPQAVPDFSGGDESGNDAGAPVFYTRLKPDYTVEAGLANISGTVELTAIFHEEGSVRDVKVVKWAGFGLDESAIHTVRRLRFKPAEIDGKRLTIRGLVRYNFNRPSSQAVASPPQNREEIERLKESLRRIMSPRRIPDKPLNF